ncbi:MAG: Rne/Rng family ribonuclease [Pyrinomonadaceae bacterium]
MSKEMVISVNGREKKIAILENGRVTEFYIERGEENSGVVGNIYKGRVQRVLPGMQSAFVNIGLERDGFLYVSDFFDEEEEIERIIQEKSKKVPAEQIEREVSDELHRARLEREKQMEAVQEIAEPMAAESARENQSELIKDEGETAEMLEPSADSKREQSSERRGKSRRNQKDRNNNLKAEPSKTAKEETPEIFELEFFESETPEAALFEDEPLFFEIGDSGFERVVDDEETPGEIFKDAYVQEAIVDKIRAIEFNMESTATAEVGSLFDSSASETNGFERIADEESEIPKKTEAAPPAKGKRKGSLRDSKKFKKKDEAALKAEESGSKNKEDDPEKPKSAKGKKQSKKETKEETLPNGEASLLEVPEITEMAVRRGGRRRSGTNRPQQNRTSSEEHLDNSVKPGGENIPAEPEILKEPRNKSDNGRRDNRDNRRERNQPTITDLLREGQDVLVQIAKEPIARKGARITSHIALPGRYIVYMPTIEHLGVSRKIESASERNRLRAAIIKIRAEETVPSGGFIVRTAGIGVSEQDLRDDARYLVRTWLDIKKQAEKSKSPALVHQDLDLTERLLRDQLSSDFAAIRIDSEDEYLKIVEFVNRIQPRMVNRVKLYTRDEPILEAYNVQEEIDKALKPRVWLKSGGYLVINQTEALVAIDVNTGKFVGRGNARLEDTITRTNMEAVDEIARQIRLRDLGGIIVLDLIDMEDRRNRNKVMQALQEALQDDKSPTKVLSFNDFGLVIMTRKRVKQSLERTMCSPCDYCQGAGLVKSPQTVCYEILEESRRLSKGMNDIRQTTLRVNPEVAKALRDSDKVVLEEIEAYLGAVDLTSDAAVHQEQFDFAFI